LLALDQLIQNSSFVRVEIEKRKLRLQKALQKRSPIEPGEFTAVLVDGEVLVVPEPLDVAGG
jgi:hypothetical protein